MNSDKTARNITKYLAKYAEPEVSGLADFPENHYDYVVLIPAYQESAEFVVRFVRQFCDIRVLLILVVNQPQGSKSTSSQQALCAHLCELSETQWSAENHRLQVFSGSAVQVLIVDRYSEGLAIPKAHGVGLARKIAADMACWLIQQNKVKNTQIYSTDADTKLPDDYFLNSHLPKNSAAGVFQFKHIASGDDEIDAATHLYEQRLEHYVSGLRFAGSAFAFHTIGSCLLVDALAYCQVRGLPKKAAGEDFYLLNKLAKQGKVQALSPQLMIQSRVSDRVPFGTGPAVQEIVQKQLTEETYPVYHPQIFVHLKTLLKAFSALTPDTLGSLNEAHFDSISQDYLVQAGFWQTCKKWQKQGYSQAQLQKALTDWFDGFRTLKYVHFLRGSDYPDIPLAQALQIRAKLGF
ncbi:hypothetical protein [Planctobacterium marinum]|uniref:hypothetical protein n=1 Tax=Planctobacterium marinum TaxID=1631968 RepID=UPI001E5F410C|nr:hypothetical protein [Planctobacterium marinum]MCC2607936.1 hypothetical protein [Planctobacterium marinum]